MPEQEIETSLTEIVEQSGLEQVEQTSITEKFDNYESIAKDWDSKAKAIKVTKVDQVAEMKMAREGRLFLREKRIAIEKTRKAMKEQSLRRGQAIDSIARYLTSLIEPIEKYLKEQEDFIDIQAKAEAERMRKEAEERAEAERLKVEKKEKLFSDRLMEIAPYEDFDHTVKLSIDTTEEEYKELIGSLKQQKTEYDNKQEQVRVENEKLKKEAEEKARKEEIEEEKRRKAREAEENRLAKERAEAQAEKDRLQQEKEKAESELKAQKEAEVKRVEEERIRAEQEKQERESAEKNKKYQEWLKSNEYDENSMLIKREGANFRMYRLVSEMTID